MTVRAALNSGVGIRLPQAARLFWCRWGSVIKASLARSALRISALFTSLKASLHILYAESGLVLSLFRHLFALRVRCLPAAPQLLQALTDPLFQPVIRRPIVHLIHAKVLLLDKSPRIIMRVLVVCAMSE